jgi:hypothetical protein
VERKRGTLPPSWYRILARATADEMQSLHGFSFKLNSHCPD